MSIIFKILLFPFLVVVFYFVITPISLVIKILQFDFLNIKTKKKLNTYWVQRNNKMSHKNFFSQWLMK